MIKLEYHPNYYRDLIALLTNTPSLKEDVERIVHLFRKNPDDTKLDNHALNKRLENKWAFSITDDIRIIYEWTGKKTVRFLAIGGHDQLYRRN